jgi:arginine N-succinyltransferase
MGLHRELFSDRTVAEMMAPITLDGQNMLWEYFGRRFIPLSYTEADKHCQRSREFIEALLPPGDIYLSLLPPEARDVVGRVGEETLPARRMLEKLGFKFQDLVDPFDGGPHLEAVTSDIPVVKATRSGELGSGMSAQDGPQRALVSALSGDGEFRAVDVPFTEERGRISIPKNVMQELGWERGQAVGITPLDTAPPKKPERKPRGKKVRS